MKKTIGRFLFTSLASFCLLNAEETSQASNPEHVTVDSRPMSSQTKHQMLEQRSKENEEQKAENESHSKKNLSQIRLAPQSYFVNNVRYDQSHRLVSVSLHGDSVELEDGSFWKVPSYKSHIVFGWQEGDLLTITPNSCFCSFYTYRINNCQMNSSIPANLYVGPIAFGPYTHWITNIDYINGQLILENGSVWMVSVGDSYLFYDWAINDTIIIGSYNGWFSSFDSLLINVNMNNYARAKTY